MQNNLTKAIKQEWLDKLKSGNYIQAFNTFTENINGNKQKYCCLAVLNTCLKKHNWHEMFPNLEDLVILNDDKNYIRTGKTDYSNVIPAIEDLPTID